MDFLALSALEREALVLSLKVALWCVAFSLPFGVLCAWVLARNAAECASGRGSGVVGYALLMLFVGFGLPLLYEVAVR